MARAALKWSIDDLARESGVSRITVIRFEREDVVSAASIEAMRGTLEKHRIQFVDKGQWAGAVYCGMRKA